MKVNPYRIAPTWLFNSDGETKLFNSQEAVDRAWDEGWFGPPWLITKTALISQQKFDTKAHIGEAVKRDPRYRGLSLNLKRSTSELMDLITEFEEANELEEFVQ